MPEYSGSALYLSYIHSAGTVALGTNYRTCSDNPDVELIEVTAGSDADKSYVTGPKSGNVSVTFLDETASGTAIYNALGTGTNGTLIISRMGTATGSPKRTIPVICQGAQVSLSYNGATEVTCEFQYNGAPTNGVN